jgi:radical SAM superfamily enzyme YgiQ (UPF0313 family)
MKLLITSVPWTDTESPLLAPALLKGMCMARGINTVAIDCNQEVLHFIKTRFEKQDLKILQEFFYNGIKIFDHKKVRSVIDYIVERILAYDPTHVALSLLTYASKIACEWICFRLRQKAPHVKIIIGGAGIFNTLESTQNIAETLLQQKQIDFYIKGDGDVSLPDLVLKESASREVHGVNSVEWQQVPDLNRLPFPDYSDYNMDLYENMSIGIVGSRGCVRRCTFCDIHEHWKKYQWRNAEDIFQELLWHYKKTKITKFKFQDSLINGNQIEFRKLMKLLAEHNEKNTDEQLKWSSFFIFRPQTQMPEQDWIDISKSAYQLTVGIESINEQVRFHMGKKFTNEDMHYCFDMCAKYKIPCHMLLIVGYVTDTEQTNKETMQWFQSNKHYYPNPISNVSLGGTLGILPGTELYRRKDELGIQLKDELFDHKWSIEKTANTPSVRLKWSAEQTLACKNAGFNVTSMTDNHLLMEQMMK